MVRRKTALDKGLRDSTLACERRRLAELTLRGRGAFIRPEGYRQFADLSLVAAHTGAVLAGIIFREWGVNGESAESLDGDRTVGMLTVAGDLDLFRARFFADLSAIFFSGLHRALAGHVGALLQVIAGHQYSPLTFRFLIASLRNRGRCET